MKILSSKKKELHDGFEEDLFSKVYSVECFKCHEAIHFKASNCRSIFELSKDLWTEISPQLKHVKTKESSGAKLYKIDDLAIYFSYFDCKNCSEKYLGIFGLGEYQPARYIFTLGALISVTSNTQK